MTIGPHSVTIGLHSVTIGLRVVKIDLHKMTVGLRGVKVGLHDATIGLHDATIGLRGVTIGLHIVTNGLHIVINGLRVVILTRFRVMTALRVGSANNCLIFSRQPCECFAEICCGLKNKRNTANMQSVESFDSTIIMSRIKILSKYFVSPVCRLFIESHVCANQTGFKINADSSDGKLAAAGDYSGQTGVYESAAGKQTFYSNKTLLEADTREINCAK